MRETWISLKCFASRFKLIAALLMLFSSGALIAIGTSAYYYDAALTRQQSAYERQIGRLESDLMLERDVNRGRIEAVAADIDSIVDSVGRLLVVAEEATNTARTAASTAKAAATTAQGAAKNAAQANITVTEIPPEPDKHAFPERIEP